MKYSLIIFDFDGTIADTNRVIINTMQAVIRELGLPTRSDAECQSTIGLPLVAVPSVLFADTDLTPELYADTYRRLFDNYNTPDAVTLFEGVRETLIALHEAGCILTIASSRCVDSLKNYTVTLHMEGLFSYLLGAESVEHPKPNAEPVLKTLEHLGITADEALVVGDMTYDILMAQNAGVATCAVTYGNDTLSNLRSCNPDHIIDHFSDLLEIVK